MERELPRWTSLWGKKSVFWFCSLLFYISGGKGEMSHAQSTLGVSALHSNYICPEGATAKLVCAQRGAASHSTDILKQSWHFTPHRDRHCVGQMGPRHTIIGGHSHGNHSLPSGLQFGFGEHNFWVILQNVTHADQGRYCCMVLDIQRDHKHGIILQKPHSHILLQVTPWSHGSKNCTIQDPMPPGGFAAVAGAIAAFILTLLFLPFILVLVYKQRQTTHSSRRAQELVRMDSEPLGYDNPVFLGGSPQIKTRTVSQIMTRQSSETGHHLLSEPGTPLSPPVHGDVFFPIEDTILESQDFMQV